MVIKVKSYTVRITIDEAVDTLILVLNEDIVGDPDKWEIVNNIGEHLRNLDNEGESFS